MRARLADGTLVALPGDADLSDDRLAAALATLTDVMGTGHHGALSAGVGPGATAVVVGDGAAGLCAVLAARRLGAERIIVTSELLDLLNVLGLLVELEPRQGDLLRRIVAGPLIDVAELTEGGVLPVPADVRRPPAVAGASGPATLLDPVVE